MADRLARPKGLPRPCQGCSKSFSPKNNKGKFCSEACKKARARRKAQEQQIGTAATIVARIPILSKLPNENHGLPATFSKPRVTPNSGWQIEAGELMFVAMAGAAPFSIEERRHFGRGHLHVGEGVALQTGAS